MWIHYGPKDNWTTGTWTSAGSSLPDSTYRGFGSYQFTDDFVVRVRAQMSTGNNISGGPVLLCNFQLTTNKQKVLGVYGNFPCPYDDVINYDFSLTNGLAYVAGLQGPYGLYQLSFVEQCTTPYSKIRY